MFHKILNRIRGETRVRVEHPAPEQILNLCAAHHISFWDLRWESTAVISLCVTRRDWERLRVFLPDDSATVLSRAGLPALWSRLYHRPVLLACLMVCGTALFISSFLIWDYDVTGNETVPEERILRALEHYGAGPGAFGLTLNGEDIRNHVLLDIPELQWISVNVSGCRAYVRVVERIEPPEILDQRTPMNITARRDGLILSVEALDGLAVVHPGMTVTAGQLLISGTEALETTGVTRMITGYGSVKARTWHTLQTSISLTDTCKQYSGRVRTAYSILFGRHRIKFFANHTVTGLEDASGYDKITHRTVCGLLGLTLPLTLIREEYQFYDTVTVDVPAAEMEKRLETILREQLAAEIAPYGEIRAAMVSGRVHDNILDVTLNAECVEEIGLSVPLDYGAVP